MSRDRFTDAAAARAIETACNEFERAWHQGQPQPIEALLEGRTEPIRSELLYELLQLEWDLRAGDGHRPELSEYLVRFPNDERLVRRAISDATHQLDTHGGPPICPHCATPVQLDYVSSEMVDTCPDCGGQLTPNSPSVANDDSSPSSVHGRFLPGTVLADRYRMVSLLGRGGMGEVYRADDLKLGQTVALKFLPRSLIRDRRRLQLFHDEVRLSRQISHPNVCRVYDIAEADGQPFISMEYVDGEDLKSLLRRIGRLPSDKGTDIARQLCAGLAAAHDAGVVHRDLKPANVMLDGRGRVRITDFGLSRLESSHNEPREFAGTPAYMAPEQMLSGETSLRSDIYSLGLLLYEILAGKPLHKGASTDELRRNHELGLSVPEEARRVDGIDRSLERTIFQCLERTPEDRPHSIAVVAGALPGGDPLAATLAAGETPSPQMVAAAGASRPMSAQAALACLLVIVVGLWAVVRHADRFTLVGQVDPKSPELLLDKVRSVLHQFGCEDHTPAAEGFEPGRIAYGFVYDQRCIEYALENDKSQRRWIELAVGQPPLVYFWYRQRSHPLTPALFRGATGALGFRREMVSEYNPSPMGAGMVSVRLNTIGNLIQFRCASDTRVNESAAQILDWDEQVESVFQLAGLDFADFEADETTEWTAPVSADTFYRWTRSNDVSGQVVEAAAFRDRIVSFRVIQPWDVSADLGSPEDVSAYGQGFTFVAIFCAVLVAATYVCYRNVRRGRGDQRTATMLAALVFIASAVEWLCLASHTSSIAEFEIFIECLSIWLFHSFTAWLFYLAAEPYVRRYWPESLTSWCKLFEGRFRDPLVGRDLLVGAVGGVISMLVIAICIRAPSWIGLEPPLPFRNWDDETLTYVLGTRYAIGGVVSMFRQAILHAVFSLLLLFVLRLLVRRPWLAAAIFVGIAAAMRWEQVPPWYVLIISLWSCIGVFLLTRYGMVACTSWLFVFFLLTIPITATGWYFAYGTFILAVVLAFAAYGLYAALGGRPLISDAKLSGS